MDRFQFANQAESDILNLIEQQDEYTSSDLQGCVAAIVRRCMEWQETPLMTAAPEMLDALQDAQDCIENMLTDLCDEPEEDIEANKTIATIQAAIAKAGGH